MGTLTPSNGSGLSNRFTGTFTHTGGATQHYLGYMLFLPTPNVVNYVATGSCLVEYNRISNGMRLIDNAGTGWLGGQSGITLGTAGATLSNNQCTVSVQGATASVNGNTMTVNVTVTFKTAIGPVLGTFLQALDVNGTWTGMTQIGNWTVPGALQTRPGPTIAGLTPHCNRFLSNVYDVSNVAGAGSDASPYQFSNRRTTGVSRRVLPGDQQVEPDRCCRRRVSVTDGCDSRIGEHSDQRLMHFEFRRGHGRGIGHNGERKGTDDVQRSLVRRRKECIR